MSKKYWEGEYDINTDWGGDVSTEGLPLPGSAVQNIIKSSLNNLNEGKVGYITETNGTVYFSSSKEAFNNEEYMGSVISTQRFSMDLQKDIDNKSVFLSSDVKKTFVWYFKTIEIATNSVFEENITVEYKITNGNKITNRSTILTANPDSNNNNYTRVELNLDEYLENGSSNIEINVRGLKTGQERPLSTKISIITLEMEDITDFAKPFTNNFIANINVNCTNFQTYYFEYRIDGGNFNDNSRIEMQGKGYTEPIQMTIDITNIAHGRHVFEYRLAVKLDSDTTPYFTKIQRIEFIKYDEKLIFNEPQILIFSSYDDENSNIIAEDGNLIIKGVSQYIPYTIRYAIYNSNSSTNVEFYEVNNGVDGNVVKATVGKNEMAEYNIQSIDNGLKTIKILTKEFENGDIEGEGIITNGNGRIIYLDIANSDLSISVYDTNLRIDFTSVGKSNDSVDKTEWVSNVKRSSGGSFKNSASFNETYDWSQGWTENGLVISEGCEAKFDYAPFPLQKDGASPEEMNEYVGGDKPYTFEIEFMTQNVTDENAVVCDMTDNGHGLQITGSEIRFTTPKGNSVSTRFKSEEMNRATIIIRPYLDSSRNFVKGLVELYVNGVLSNITKYTEDEKFEVIGMDDIGNAISKPLTFVGTKGADIVVKYIRAYNGAMSADDVVNNFIIFRTNSKEMLNLYNKNNVMDVDGVITPETMVSIGNIPILIFIGRTDAENLASGDGNYGDGKGNCNEPYSAGTINANDINWYETLEKTTNKKKNIDMDVIYYNPLDKKKNFKLVKAYITPQGTSSMYYPKKNYRIYTQKNKDTRMFLSDTNAGILELDMMLESKFGEKEEDRKYEVFRGTKNYKKRVYSFKDNAQPVKCWCLKADFAETSSSHNTGVARLWGDTLKNSTVAVGGDPVHVFKTTAQATIESKYNNNINGDMPDVRTTIDGFPIVVFGAKAYGEPIKFLGQYNFNNDKSTESVFGFCDIDDVDKLKFEGIDNITNEKTEVISTLDGMLDKYMSCVETLDNGNALANFSVMDNWDEAWEDAFEFRYPEIPEKPKESDYKENGVWKEGGEAEYNEAVAEYNEDLRKWKNTHLKPFKHFAEWVYSTRWCDVNGNILEGISEEEAALRKEKFNKEKWEHLDVWKMAAYYVYAMRFGAVDQIVKNSMLTSEGPFAYNADAGKYGYWDTTDEDLPEYGKYYKWYYINYDNDTVMGVKNDGSLAYGPDITRRMKEGYGSTASYIYAGSTSTLWNNFDQDDEFQQLVRIADQGISKVMTYKKTIEMFDIEQVGKWCERIYNKDAEYKYIDPYISDWKYEGDDENADNFADKLFMLQGSRTAHRHWWLSKRFNLFDGKWNSGDFATKYIEIKCDYGSIGDTFSAVAGSNAYFGYQINNKTFGDGAADGGTSYEYNSGEEINWKLYKNIQIGDPIAIYGSTDMVELNLEGLSKNLSSLAFYFGNNEDVKNKLEVLKISVPENLLFAESSYRDYSDDAAEVVNGKTAYEKLQIEYPDIFPPTLSESNWAYPTSDEKFNATDKNSPNFYRTPVAEDGIGEYTYFAKVTGGIRNYSCTDINFDKLDKLQELYIAGYMGLNGLTLKNNKFINKIDARYSNISTITIAEGSRINEFKASSVLNSLVFNRCNNIKMNNIIIDDTTLKINQGKNLRTINVTNSDGLNHSAEFKDFILSWIDGGKGFVPTAQKTLILKGIKWRNVTVNNIKSLLKFIKGDETTGGVHAMTCNISGSIEMSNENISRASMDIIDEFRYYTNGVDVTVKIPTNIMVDVPTGKESIECVAGNTVKIGCEIYPSKNIVSENNGLIEYTFVREIDGNDESYTNKLFDTNTGKYYIKIDTSEVRNGIRFDNRLDEDLNATLYTEEIITNEDTKALVAVILTMNGIDRFDIVPILIKDPTYAVNGEINGSQLINEQGYTYTYNLSLISNKGFEPIGTINVNWSLENFEGTYGNGLDYIVSSAISSNNRTLIITTSSELTPERIAKFNIIANVDNFDKSGYLDKTFVKQVTILNKDIIMTNETNPTVMSICYNMFNTESNEYMTKDEAANVKSIGTAFSGKKASNGWTFEELKFFTGIEEISENAFKDSDITLVTIPNNVKSLGKNIFSGCVKLKNVILPDDLYEIPEGAFLNCRSLENVIIPDTVSIINTNAFGGVGMRAILFHGMDFDDNKAIYLSEECALRTINNNAFEVTNFNTNAGNTNSSNVLEVISLPNYITLGLNNYNFVLSENLKTINITVDSASIRLDNNVLYADSDMTTIVRVLSNTNDEKISYNFTNVKNVYPYAFYCCKGIKTITFGLSLEKYALGTGAFYGSEVEEIDLSESVLLENLYSYTFFDMSVLNKVLLPQNGKLEIFGSYLFNNCPKLKNLIIPDTVTTLGTQGSNNAYTFVNCGFEELILPDSLCNGVSVRFVISACKDLMRVKLPSYMKNMSENNIIENCPLLEEVILPAFTYTNENGDIVILNKSIATGNYPYINSCPNLKRYILSENDNRIYFEDNENGALYQISNIINNTVVPHSEKKLAIVPYAATDYNKYLIDDVTVIGSGAYSDTKITEFNTNGNITLIEIDAFRNCTSLKFVKFDEHITSINDSTFFNCSELEILIVLGDLSYIGSFALCGCSKLKELVMLSTIVPSINVSSIINITYNNKIEVTYEYHPFGYRDYNLVGVSSDSENSFYLPYDYMLGLLNEYDKKAYVVCNGNNIYSKYSFYDTEEEAINFINETAPGVLTVRETGGVWGEPLFNVNLSNFKKKCYTLNEKTNSLYVTVIVYKNGIEVKDTILYFKSHSGDFKFANGETVSSTYNTDGYKLLFNDNVYHNEPIYVYDSSDCSEESLIGEFVAKCGENRYSVGNVLLGNSRTNAFFSSNLVIDNQIINNESEEMANITKKEYEVLLSRINQMAELLNKIK